MAKKNPWYLNELNEQQLEAVLHKGTPLLILAGAGSGKTRVITTKIAYLIDTGKVDPHAILAVTFTNKAAGEMQARVTAMAGGSGSTFISTFHSFGAWILRRNSHLLDLNSRFTIYDDDDSVTLLNSIFENNNRAELKKYAHFISRAKDYALAPDDDLNRISFDPDFPAIYRVYQNRLKELGNVDFGDLILKPLELLQTTPEVKLRMQQRFKVILVDEYQDSNVAQFKLLKELFGTDTYLCVVGDDDQSIYRFRGAEVQNILFFPEVFPHTKVIRLERNYRSTEKILSVASQVVVKNRGRLGKTLWTDKKGGVKPALVFLENQRQEAEYCANLLSDGKLKDTAILYRTNAQSREFETVFSRLNILYHLVGTLSFYEREEVKDTLALLSLLINPKNIVAFQRILNKPARNLGKVAVNKILSFSENTGGDLLKACTLAKEIFSGKAKEGITAFVLMFETFIKTLPAMELAAFVHRLIIDSGLLDYHKEQDHISGTQKVKNLEELVSAAAAYHGGIEGLLQFLEDVELDRSLIASDVEDTRERVTLITMHNTKGLEFNRVIITGLEEGLFPSIKNDLGEDDLEEERRIFYVSITRARELLFLTSCKTRRIWGKTVSLTPSRFLSEIPKELLTVSGQDWGVKHLDEEAQEYAPGIRVYHEDYGAGVVCKSWNNGQHLSVLVQFESGLTAQFIPKYSKLERISRDEW
ncbi:MAG: UvrD-helicase domain-containing protein [Spirochaetota bacterium]